MFAADSCADALFVILKTKSRSPSSRYVTNALPVVAVLMTAMPETSTPSARRRSTIQGAEVVVADASNHRAATAYAGYLIDEYRWRTACIWTDERAGSPKGLPAPGRHNLDKDFSHRQDVAGLAGLVQF